MQPVVCTSVPLPPRESFVSHFQKVDQGNKNKNFEEVELYTRNYWTTIKLDSSY